MLLSLSPFTCSYTFICSYALICSASPLYVLFTFFLIFHSCLHKITGVTTLKQHLFRLMMTIVSLWCCVLLLSEGIKTSPLIGTKNQKVKTSCECQQWSLSSWEMPSLKLLQNFSFLFGFFGRGWIFLGSCIQWDEDTPGELILLRGKMWRCSVFANYTASPAAFSKARFVKLPRPRICSLHFFFLITSLNSKVHLSLRKII